MRKARRILVCLVVVLCQGTPVWGGPVPSPLQGVTLGTKVSKDDQTGILTYRYRVFSPVANDGSIWHIDIEISRGPTDALLSREGLLNGPRYLRHSSEDAFQRIPMVPVGISGPKGWLSSLGFTENPPRGFASWGGIEDSSLILPGRIFEGFQLTSYGLPGIRSVEIQPDIDWDNVPDEFSTPERARQLRDSLIFSTKTIGPKAPPQTFVPLEFLNYLMSLVHDSRQQGWVREAKEAKKLLQDLLKAKRRLEAGDPGKARSALKEFLERVKHEGCRGFHCPKNKALTSEAYALLYFNGKFLQAKLPKPPGDRDDDRDDD